MTSQPGLQKTAIHNCQRMKFGQLIEYNKINIFLQKLYRKLGKETRS